MYTNSPSLPPISYKTTISLNTSDLSSEISALGNLGGVSCTINTSYFLPIMAERLTLDPPLPSHVVHQFDPLTFLGSLAVRSNGQILLAVVGAGSVVLLDPANLSSPTLIHKFEGLAVTGIIEVEEDCFYIAAGKIDIPTVKTEFGSWSIWKIDMRGFEKEGVAEIEKVTDLPNSGLPNGLESIPNNQDSFLFADSEVGASFKVDARLVAPTRY